jgi:glycosyltransferase involved in cell wall biosynthesis
VRFGFVGGISHLKGYHVIKDAFAGLKASNYELVLVDNTLKLGFSSIDPSDWQIAGKLRVVPSFDQGGLDAFFDGIDVLLFPSQWKESFGLIVAEALARDVWVIVTEGGGAAEFVVEGANGTLIPLRNEPGPLRAAVEALLADPERLRLHVNPYKSRIHGYGAQAEELHGMLERAAALPSSLLTNPLPLAGEGVEGVSGRVGSG